MNMLIDALGYTFVMTYFGVLIVLVGICVGSFLNVVIFRFNTSERASKGHSHCMTCNHPLAWYDNIPLISYLLLKGKCRYCKTPISKQYPIVEALNSAFWLILFFKFGLTAETIFYCLMVSALIPIVVIDEKYFVIPNACNLYLFFVGVGHFIFRIMMNEDWLTLLIGSISVAAILLLFYVLTAGNGLGFGDVKLMFVCGLIVGLKSVFVGFIAGCIIAIVIHTIRMKFSNKSHKLAFGPYLCIGVYLGLFIGQLIADWYMNLIGAMIG